MFMEASVSFLEMLMGFFGVIPIRYHGKCFYKNQTTVFMPSKVQVLGLSLPYTTFKSWLQGKEIKYLQQLLVFWGHEFQRTSQSLAMPHIGSMQSKVESVSFFSFLLCSYSKKRRYLREKALIACK
jgi:hypothetical protein